MTFKRVVFVLLMFATATLACNLPAAQDTPPPAEITPADAGSTEPPAEQPTAAADAATPLPGAATAATLTQAAPATATVEASDTPRAATRAAGAAGPPAHGDEVYRTDFQTRWVEVTSADNGVVKGRATPGDGGMLFDVAPSWAMWVYSQQDDVSEFYAELTAQPRDCPAGSTSAYGLMFHFRDNDNFRAFALTCRGGYRLYEYSGSGERLLASGELGGGIDSVSGRHTIAVLAQGTTLSLYVDGAVIDSVNVVDMPPGDLGPFVDTENAGVQVLFESLVVYEATP